MAFNLASLLASLDSSIAALDSASELLEVLQAINATNPTKGNGKSQRKYYASVADLPAADSSLRGMVTVVSTAVENSDNGLYLCTGTAWTEIQDLDSTTPYSFQGSNFGYVSGGGPPASNVIEKFPFASDANASDVGDLSEARFGPAGQSSALHGYTSGGYGSSNSNVIDKFPFSSNANASDVGDLFQARYGGTGQSSAENGYTSGGINFTFSPVRVNIIDKFAFISDGNATDVGDLTSGRYSPAGQSSTTHGYSSGGINPDLPISLFNNIEKFPFASDANATDVGDLTEARNASAGQSSSDNGYSSGGAIPGVSNVIDKFAFASDGNASDVGDLFQARSYAAGQSSTNNGYTSGGAPLYNNIDKFPFASDANAADVGDLTTTRTRLAGQQY